MRHAYCCCQEEQLSFHALGVLFADPELNPTGVSSIAECQSFTLNKG